MNARERLLLFLEHLGIGQGAFEKRVGISNGYINNIKSSIGSSILERITEAYPELNAMWILNGEGDMLLPKVKNEVQAISNPHVLEVPLVSKYAYAGYTVGYGDDEYLEALPTIPFMVTEDRKPRGQYCAFEVKGDSMDDGSHESIKEGDIIMCRLVQPHLWYDSQLHFRRWNFVIVHEEGILIKRIIDHDVENGTITIHSLNEMYEDQVISLSEVKQIFNVVQLTRSPRL